MSLASCLVARSINFMIAKYNLFPSLSGGKDFANQAANKRNIVTDGGNHAPGNLMSWPANPGARILKGMANGSPSPWEKTP